MYNNIEDKPYTPVDPSSAAAMDPSFSWFGLIGMIIVFLLILFVSLLIIKNLKKTTMGIGDAKWVRVIERQHLGGQQMLYLVEIAGKLQVLGGSDHCLVKISEIDDPEVAAEILADIAARPFEEEGGLLPAIFRKITSFKNNQKFSAELQDLMEEANHEDFKNER